MNNEEHRKRHIILHQALDELFADYMLHNKEARPSTSTVIELMLWSSVQCNNPNGRHRQAPEGNANAVSFSQLALSYLGGDMHKRVGPAPLRGISHPLVEKRRCALCGGPGPFPSEEEVKEASGGKYIWTDTCRFCEKDPPVPVNERYDCEKGGKCRFLPRAAEGELVCHKCGLTREQKVKNEK
jgi:hypothetical protein